jgi:hypothetical protein
MNLQAWRTSDGEAQSLGDITDTRPAQAVVSYFRGKESEWKTGLPTYEGVVYSDLLQVYTETGARLKYTFIVII